MRFSNFIIAFILLSITIQISAFGQQPDSVILNNILDKSKKLAEEHPIEKVYLHFDKPYYSVADTIWFKAYLTMEQNLPSLLSKIVYVDVLNSKDSLVQSIKIPVVKGMATGNIPLNQGTYLQGNYYIKAYTLWMINFGEAYYFSKTIPIGEAIDKQLTTHFSFKTSQTDKNQTIDAVVQFRNRDNMVQTNKTVNWRMLSNYDVVTRGKGTTDQNGFLRIKIDSKKSEAITNGELITELAIAENDVVSSSFKIKPPQGTHDMQFFPEGGEIISGVASRIGFKAVNPSGLGIDLKGTIVDNSGAVLNTFESSHLGMGSFYLTADEAKSYKANIIFKDGSTKSFDLPKALPSGVTLQISNTDPTAINLKMIANDLYFSANKNKTLFIIGSNGGVIYYAAKTKLSTQLTTTKIPRDKFPTGITQITLFSETGDPISERLTFNPSANNVSVTLKTDLPTYKPKQKAKLTVTAKTATTPVEGDYSISVTDAQKVPVDEDNEITILSSLLLTSELKGYIEKPNYYFNKPSEKKTADLDVLMLTQGFRRFNYKDIMAGKFPVISILPEQDMSLSGTLRDRTGMPVRKGALRLTVTGSRYAAETLTSPSGKFVFPNLTIPDSSEVVINAKYSANGSNLMIVMDPQNAAPLTKGVSTPDEIVNIDSALAPYLNNSKKQYNFLRTLKEVKIETKVKRPSHADHSSLAGLSSISGTLIEGERFKGCNSMALCLQTMAMGLTYFENNFYVSRDYQAGSRVPVQIFLNGTPIDYFGLTSVQPTEVESVEVFPKDELGTVNRMYNTNGVLVINTKKPVKGTKISLEELKKMMPEANILKIRPKGFSKQREFYLPKYVNPANTYNFNDLRTTIYWNPNVATTATGPLTLEYYNADGNGAYRAVIEGIDKNGNVSRYVYRYTVK
ncbi:carboxypeptidase-like regulatory domain-containing protein [Pedobacter frigoris]|uniref:Carboxypeptidase regulatory-like domain-containing protein n=1 Tax=Pedobacter frigoris TaxID=2571272 RepID=A0A4U1CM06_9SPHI|nr:carboxypeptidase-like regulatory domain-containing protein [Pedobacter frigoris]TKC07371.1 carboxypeptidase regulatory-like domain-containing protein [Pedobacter frigoris]